MKIKPTPRQGLRSRVRPGQPLTDRERDALLAWGESKSPKSVAARLNLSIDSVRTALQSARVKLDTPGVGGTQRAFDKLQEVAE